MLQLRNVDVPSRPLMVHVTFLFIHIQTSMWIQNGVPGAPLDLHPRNRTQKQAVDGCWG